MSDDPYENASNHITVELSVLTAYDAKNQFDESRLYMTEHYVSAINGVDGQSNFEALRKELNKKKKGMASTLKSELISNGSIPYSNESDLVVVRLEDLDLDSNPTFRDQLEDEGMTDWWVCTVTSKDRSGIPTLKDLPIYGSSSRWVTKWFSSSPEGAVDKATDLFKKAVAYANETQLNDLKVLGACQYALRDFEGSGITGVDVIGESDDGETYTISLVTEDGQEISSPYEFSPHYDVDLWKNGVTFKGYMFMDWMRRTGDSIREYLENTKGDPDSDDYQDVTASLSHRIARGFHSRWNESDMYDFVNGAVDDINRRTYSDIMAGNLNSYEGDEGEVYTFDIMSDYFTLYVEVDGTNVSISCEDDPSIDQAWDFDEDYSSSNLADDLFNIASDAEDVFIEMSQEEDSEGFDF